MATTAMVGTTIVEEAIGIATTIGTIEKNTRLSNGGKTEVTEITTLAEEIPKQKENARKFQTQSENESYMELYLIKPKASTLNDTMTFQSR